jgi:hypothetical protein
MIASPSGEAISHKIILCNEYEGLLRRGLHPPRNDEKGVS